MLPKSKTSPFIIMFYSDWCFECMRAAGAFKKVIDSLETLGVTFATINAGHESHLVRKIGVHALPCIALILDEHSYVFKESIFSVQKVVDFVRQKLPYKLIPIVKDGTVHEFLTGWWDNRVRALVFEPRQQQRLRYLLTAYQFRYRVAFGFVQTGSGEAKSIIERYKVHPNLDTLLIFNEDALRPVASIGMTDIPTTTLNNIIGANQYLALPRLSSQEMLEGIICISFNVKTCEINEFLLGVCPAEWNRPRKKLCVILITENSENHNHARQALRKIALESTYSPERVRFAYIFKEKQLEFINAISVNSGSNDTNLRLVIIWRRDAKHIKYEWLKEINIQKVLSVENNTVDASYNHTKQKINEVIMKLLRSSEALSFEAEVKVRYFLSSF